MLLKLQNLMIVFAIMSATVSCKNAGYEVGGLGKKKDDPESVAPPPAPVAKVEAIANNVVVTEVVVGTPVLIRPTADTIYGAAKTNCPNSGYVTIQYDTGDGRAPTVVNRATGCEPPEINNTYIQPGVYTIKMTATTSDGKKMEATTVINVKASTTGGTIPGSGGQNPSQQGSYNPYDPCGCEPPTYYYPCGC